MTTPLMWENGVQSGWLLTSLSQRGKKNPEDLQFFANAGLRPADSPFGALRLLRAGSKAAAVPT